MALKLFHTGLSSLGILFWGNLLTVAARWQGVTRTVRFIKKIASWLPLYAGDLDQYSIRIDKLRENLPFLFFAHRQGCLIRGLLLLFFGKRRKLNVQLHFGSKIVDQRFDTHCWISLDGKVRFEVDEVVRQYTPLIEYM